MPHILKNKNLEIRIDLPHENYKFSRFDWTGKIVSVKFQGIPVSAIERPDNENEHIFGKGFYNEFGIDMALGFSETEIGGWFHKIGVGLLKKVDPQYLFSKKYEVKPAEFQVSMKPNKLILECRSAAVSGFSYFLKKEIEIDRDSFRISYYLENTGERDMETTEYVHNFMAIAGEFMGSDYVLRFPFLLNQALFDQVVNPERKLDIAQKEIRFNGLPTDEFFFSNLSGHKTVVPEWQLMHLKHKIGIKETGDFSTNKVNVWGWKHVISPELFIDIFLKPGESKEWARTYQMFLVE
jgi:hypothetical protein